MPPIETVPLPCRHAHACLALSRSGPSLAIPHSPILGQYPLHHKIMIPRIPIRHCINTQRSMTRQLTLLTRRRIRSRTRHQPHNRPPASSPVPQILIQPSLVNTPAVLFVNQFIGKPGAEFGDEVVPARGSTSRRKDSARSVRLGRDAGDVDEDDKEALCA